ncbi:hypothetical protein SALBM135S_02416 [Streptomyces alboniger]
MAVSPSPEHPRHAIETVFRMESPRVIAGVARIVRDVGIAEELAQDALVAALEQWPARGVPDNPGAWLMTTARRRAVDLVRRRERYADKLAEMGRDLESAPPRADEPADPDDIDDDLLRLVFTACHPVLSAEARVALTLRLLGGLTTAEIARAVLAPEATVAQRIVRAKRTLAARAVAFEVPYGPDREARVGSVLSHLPDLQRGVRGHGRRRLAAPRPLRGRPAARPRPRRAPAEGVRGTRPGRPARTPGLPRGGAHRTLRRAGAPEGPEPGPLEPDAGPPRLRRPGPRAVRGFGAAPLWLYALQAAIAACHAHAHTYEETDWRQIAALYALLAARTPSPVVELNRAVAVSMADRPAAGLALVDALTAAPALRGYHLLPSVRGDLLARLGRPAQAREEFERAASLTRNQRERELLLARAAALLTARLSRRTPGGRSAWWGRPPPGS